MNILGIETSCDETSAAVVKDGRFILSNVVVSSLKSHAKFGGIIPEIASRRQLECITPVVDKALSEAKCNLNDIQAVAVTAKPGLIGSLIVGISFARAFAEQINQPLIEVDHVKAHLYANFLTRNKNTPQQPKLPAIGLVVSGGHTQLYQIKKMPHFRLLGQTRDDAAGEAFDKVARILGLGYPGGPVIDRLAESHTSDNLTFKAAEMPNTFDFSFSGVKTAVLYHHQKKSPLTKKQTGQTAHAFQESVVDILVRKSLAACRKYKAQTLLIGGGVAANSRLRNALENQGKKLNLAIHVPPIPLCLDNAAMIAGLAYHQVKNF